jgi:polygalacturonase
MSIARLAQAGTSEVLLIQMELMYVPRLPITICTDIKVQTVYANNITFLRWIISNGDDSISMKQNSTNIYIANCTFYNGLSFAMGSIGQYPGQVNVIENVTAENIILYNTIYGGRIKTVRKSTPLISLDG